MATSGKQYGLLVPKKAGPNLQPRHSIFGDDSDSESVEGSSCNAKPFKNESIQKRQTKLDIKKALEQDPTVYQYDEVYDEMEERKMEQKNKKKDPEKKPKYIQSLLATAERRKREQERRTERKVQKEREAEGEEFKDKESFVTSAYRKKLEEFQEMDEQERLQDKIEEITDVAKQKDLGGFYRHLFRQTVGDEEKAPKVIKEEEEKNNQIRPNEEDCESEEKELLAKSQEASGLKSSGKSEERSYRKRKVSSSSESDGKTDDVDRKAKVTEGSDGDSDSSSSDSSSSSSSDSSSSSSGDEDVEVKVNKKKEVVSVDKKVGESDRKSEPNRETSDSKSEKVNGIVEQKASDIVDEKSGREVTAAKASSGEMLKEKDSGCDVKKEKDSDGDVKKDKVPEEPKPNIWEKKTVGPVFDAALQRYMSRKAARMSKSS
ncbi:nuclear speckle splicing regulatory protein 1-like [Hetaerina americana]|uniref:nuclear speckle splicing regulatory protein 1-like n=1 Tax=Hetaerina americana TaxID=62018 RepID=UPI003A7F206B